MALFQNPLVKIKLKAWLGLCEKVPIKFPYKPKDSESECFLLIFTQFGLFYKIYTSTVLNLIYTTYIYLCLIIYL